MPIFPSEPKINLYEDDFSEPDVLDRAKIGRALSNLLMRFDDPVVVALDGQWGAGKTYFLKRWVGQHSKDHGAEGRVVYFDAFAHDYISDPLPALVSAVLERLPKSESKSKLENAAYHVVKVGARFGLSMATNFATEVLPAVGDVVAEDLSDKVKDKVQSFWTKQASRQQEMEEFRAVLEQLAAPSKDQETARPLVIVIDELDRCRPDYALEVLEVIKHFFSVPHVHFVLGVNLKALENSVRARYGDKIDAEVYLRKFIQLKLELPSTVDEGSKEKPAYLVYLDHLLK